MADVPPRRQPTLAAGPALALLAGALGAGVLIAHLLPAPPPGRPPGSTYAALREVPPEAVLYEEVDRYPVAAGCRALAAAPGGGLLAAGRKLERFGPRGERLPPLTPPAPARALAATAAGEIYLATETALHRLAADGTARQSVPLPPGALVTSLATAGEAVVVADADGAALWRYGPALKEAPRRLAAGFRIPSPTFDVAAAGAEALWTVDPGRHRLLKLDPATGEEQARWGAAGHGLAAFCGCCNPAHVALTPVGEVVTAEKGLRRVKLYTPSGRLLGVVAPPAAFTPGTVIDDLMVDGRGRICILDRRARAVRLFARRPDPQPEETP
jgi:hypothetical protein